MNFQSFSNTFQQRCCSKQLKVNQRLTSGIPALSWNTRKHISVASRTPPPPGGGREGLRGRQEGRPPPSTPFLHIYFLPPCSSIDSDSDAGGKCRRRLPGLIKKSLTPPDVSALRERTPSARPQKTWESVCPRRSLA